MEIKCVRCGKGIENANRDNAKYIMNIRDKRTWGVDKKEKIIKVPLTSERIHDILKEKTAMQREFIRDEKGEVIQIIEHPFTMNDFLKSTEIYPDAHGRRETTIEEEVEKPKTAIICLKCLEKDDIVIW